MDRKRRTFKLSDLDETFWEKVITVSLEHSSGLGGWGCLWIVTSEKREYFIGFEGFPYNEYHLEEFSPLFKRKDKVTDYKHPYAVEKNGWKYIWKEKTLVRDDFYDEFMKVYENEKGKRNYIHIPDITAKVLKTEKLERFDYEETVKLQEKWDAEWKAREEKRERLKLTEEHFHWKSLYYNNDADMFENGKYALIFKEVEGKVVGYRFSVLYQKREESPLHLRLSAKTEAYNLFEKQYDDVQGDLYYEKVESQSLGAWGFGGADQTLNQYEINCPGEFVRSFKKLEEAQKYAVAITNIRNYANKENLIQDLENPKRKYKNLLRKYETAAAFKQYYSEILELVSQYEYPDASCAGGKYIFDDVKEKMKIDEGLLGEMWKYVPQVLGKRAQKHAEEMILECWKNLEN